MGDGARFPAWCVGRERYDMTHAKHAGGRPRKGTLEFRGKSWHARLTVTVEGESLRKWFDLGTDNKAVARRKLARLIDEQSKANPPTIAELAEEAANDETVAQAVRRVVKHQGTEGLKTWKERLSRLERYALPALAKLRIKTVRPLDL